MFTLPLRRTLALGFQTGVTPPLRDIASDPGGFTPAQDDGHSESLVDVGVTSLDDLHPAVLRAVLNGVQTGVAVLSCLLLDPSAMDFALIPGLLCSPWCISFRILRLGAAALLELHKQRFAGAVIHRSRLYFVRGASPLPPIPTAIHMPATLHMPHRFHRRQRSFSPAAAYSHDESWDRR